MYSFCNPNNGITASPNNYSSYVYKIYKGRLPILIKFKGKKATLALQPKRLKTMPSVKAMKDRIDSTL